jgi:hypothetical protein
MRSQLLSRARERFDVPRFASARPDAATQLLLRERYRELTGRLDRPLSEYGFSAYSQTDEDGILLYLFARLGIEHRTAVEICAGHGIECNTANLILNHGWDALLLDGDAANVRRGREFFSRAPQSRVFPPEFAQEWITRDNVNSTVEKYGFRGEVDLLSLDLDGVDWWIWKALTTIAPRVVVLEYQDILGPERSWTVPYADDFSSTSYSFTDGMPDFAGASLSAFARLGTQKGYRLVGVNRYGYNAFFVRNDLGDDILPAVEPRHCFTHRKNLDGMRTRFSKVARLPWEEVS